MFEKSSSITTSHEAPESLLAPAYPSMHRDRRPLSLPPGGRRWGDAAMLTPRVLRRGASLDNVAPSGCSATVEAEPPQTVAVRLWRGWLAR